MRIGIAQMDIRWEDRRANFERVERFAAEAVERGVDLLVLPEMFGLGFTMDGARFAEDDGGPTTRFLARTARTTGMHILGACVFEGREKPRNAALLVSPRGEILARYDKVHPFSMSGEHLHYEAGTEPVVAEALGFGIQLSICYDLRFPEIYLAGIDRGATLIAVIASWPATREAHWRLLARARAIDGLAYVAACNRTGKGGGLVYPGASMVVDPEGEVLVNGGREEALYTADLDPRKVEAARRKFPFLRDRRPELYRSWLEGP